MKKKVEKGQRRLSINCRIDCKAINCRIDCKARVKLTIENTERLFNRLESE